METFNFANKEYLYILITLIPYIAWYIWKNKSAKASLTFSNVSSLKNIPKSAAYYTRHSVFLLKILGIAALIIALARPQSYKAWQETTTEGIDIVLAMDISGSMLAQDFQPNRIEASKKMAIKFISGRTSDRIGLVIFAGESYTQCPATVDHKVLINYFKDISTGIIEDGTAIGLGLANAVNRLKNSDAKSKVVILLTDGDNNSGQISPSMASDLAQTYGIRVYTIGVGSKGLVPVPVQTAWGPSVQKVKMELNDEVLKEIAEKTGGKYFRATNNKALENIYAEIDKMEKIKIEQRKHKETKENYLIFAIWSLILLSVSVLLKNTVFKTIF